MNKVSLAEAGDGSPPFWRFDQIERFHKWCAEWCVNDSSGLDPRSTYHASWWTIKRMVV